MFDNFFKDEKGNTVLMGVGVLVAFVILIALGGLLANSFTNAAALPAGNAFNVSTTTSTYYPTTVTIGFVAVLALIGIPILGMMMFYFAGRPGR